jgi:hypothetical protein
MPGRHGSCSCASQTRSSSARTCNWPSVCGFIELAEADRHVAADDDRALAGLDDDHLHAACVARRRNESESGQQLMLAVDRHVLQTGGVDPLANGVVVFAARVVELLLLDVDRRAGEEVVAAAVVEVQVVVDDDVDAGEIEVLFAQWPQAGIEIGHRRGAAPLCRCRPARAHRDGR